MSLWHRGLLDDAAREPADSRSAPPDWPRLLAEQARQLVDPRLRRYAAAGVAPGDTPLARLPMAALDFETTGLDPDHDQIVSIGLVPFGMDLIRASQGRHWIVQPRGGLTAASVAYHGITHSQVDQAPDLDAVLAELLDAMAGRVMVVHCRAIERGFLAAALQARLGESLAFPVIDTMALAAQQAKQPPSPSSTHRAAKAAHEARASRQLWRRWWPTRQRPIATKPSLRLADCRERLGLPAYHAHHALTDALATAELLLAQLAADGTPGMRAEQLWC